MADDGREQLSNEEAVTLGRRVGVGCFTLFAGLWSGGMVGVLVGKVVAEVRRAPSCPGLPTCDWYLYAMGGAIIGAVTLPALVFWRLRRREADKSNLRG